MKSDVGPLKCLIVDDEALAHQVIKSHLAQIDSAILAGQCYNGAEAYNFLLKENIDLMFLDIHMPELNGLDLIKSLSNRPKVILTTAYSEYALESYELDVVDYLLKPIGFSRFLTAFNKVLRMEAPKAKNGNVLGFKDIKANGMPLRFYYSELEYLEGMGNYVKLYLTGRMVLVPGRMQEWEEDLANGEFCRVHKSFIVNMRKVIQVIHYEVTTSSGVKLPIGRKYKALLHDRLRISHLELGGKSDNEK
jgi:DNA-binding LytR/AlgR family response regulator